VGFKLTVKTVILSAAKDLPYCRSFFFFGSCLIRAGRDPPDVGTQHALRVGLTGRNIIAQGERSAALGQIAPQRWSPEGAG
jgi:hypothetical protein